MQKTSSKENVALSSVTASFVLTVIKLIVGLLTGSIGILSEAAHSLLDLGAAALTYFAVKFGDKPPDKNHPYGHGKIESVSALIETGLLFLTSAWIIFEAVKKLIDGKSEIEVTWYAFAVMIVSVVIDFSRSKALNKIAKETKSQALEADAMHFSSDILSSLVVIGGLFFSAIGVHKADAVAAIGVSLFVLHAGWSLGKRTMDVLLDAAPEGLTEKITEIASSVEGVLEVKKARVRNVGAASFIEMCVGIGHNVPVNAVKKITDTIESKIHDVIQESDITIETEPISLSNESIIDQVQMVAQQHGLSIHDIAVHADSREKSVSFDLEVLAETPFKKAHQISTHLEETLQSEFGKDLKVNIHIEPYYAGVVKSSPVVQKNIQEIMSVISSVSETIPIIKEVHEIKMTKTGNSIFVSLHCVFDDNQSLDTVHEATSLLENSIRLKIPSVKRVLVHPEPETEKG
jgi:cation diffusion facilitator family transporter